MIVDWYTHSQKINKTKIIDLEGENKKYKIRQEIVYLKYLFETLGYSADMVFAEWKKIKNGVAALFDGDEEQQTIEFYHLLKKLDKPMYKKVNCSKPLDPINIYAEEIKFLNDLSVPKWVKEFWFGMLFYYKFEVQNSKRVQATSTLNNWCIHNCLSLNGDYYRYYQDCIAKYKLQLGFDVVKYQLKQNSEKYNTYIPCFITTEGRVVKTFNSINQIKTGLKLLKSTEVICPVCGKKHSVTSKSKTDLCDECYKKERRRYLNSKTNNYHKQKRLELIE